MNKLYCKTEDKLIYEVEIGNKWDNHIQVNLHLVCGWDYIDTDYSNIQGWVKPDRFVTDTQYSCCTWVFYEESLKQCLTENGYEIVEKLPKIN